MPGTSNSPISALRAWLFAFVMVVALVATPLTVLSQTEVPVPEPVAEQAEPVEAPPVEEPAAEEPLPAQAAPEEQVQHVQQAPAPPSTGSLEVRLTAPNGGWLSGQFAVTDAAGNYHERWTDSGVAWFSDLVAGTATVHQLSGTTDFWFDRSDPDYIDVPAGGYATQPIVNTFLDDDNDAVGNSVDICGAGDDALDTDADGTPDACDATPNGDTDGDGIDELTDSTPNGDDDADGVDNLVDACPKGDDANDTDADGTADACDDTPEGETPTEIPTPDTSAMVAEVAAEPVMVDGAPVSCDQFAGLNPTLASNGAEYAPGAVVTLTGSGWAPGQLVQIAIDDDGTIDAAQGDWSQSVEATADDTGAFTHELTLPAGVAATYRAVATGQCSAAPVEMAEIVAEVAAEPEVVAEAPVTCQQADAVAPFIATDLADYPPGSTVTLTGGNWVAGQTIEILVEDDGIADAERGPWSHTATVTADAQGAFTYQFNIAPWFVADYSVVATGECSKAETSFTDTVQMSMALSPTQVPTSSLTTFSVTFTNNTTSPDISTSNNLGCVRIAVPSNYSVVTASATIIATSGGKSWSVGTATNTEIILLAGSDTARLSVDEQVTVRFNATTPSGTGSSNFTATGRTGMPSACPTGGGAAFGQQSVGVNRIDIPKYSASAQIRVPASAAVSVSSPNTQITIRITNTSNEGENLGSAKILIPAGFLDPTVTSFTGSNFVVGNPTWQTAYNPTQGKILSDALDSNNFIKPGGWIEITFTVTTPSTPGTRTFTAEAWKDKNFSGNPNGFTSQPVLTVNAAVTAPTATDLALNCIPNPNPATVNAGQPVTVNCTYSAVSTLGTRTVTLTQVTVPAPSGWSISSTFGTVSGQTLTISPTSANTISFSPVQNFTFSYTLTPACTALTTNQAVALTSQFTFNGGIATTGATFNGQVARTDASSLAIALQTPSALGWSQPFSFTSNTVTGSFVYRLMASGCGGWNVLISASDFIYSGASNGTQIPAANLELTSAGAPTAVTGSDSGVTAQPASGPMSSSKKVLAAAIGTGIGSYDQQLNFSLAIPANTRVGSYTSTITIASATGP